MASLTKLTKAQLIARINECEAETVAAIAFVEAQREEIARLKAQAATPRALRDVPVHMHRAYYDYVRSTKAEQQANGQRVVSYKTMSQWLESSTH